MSKYNVPPIFPLRLIFTTENHATLLRFLAMLLPCKTRRPWWYYTKLNSFSINSCQVRDIKKKFRIYFSKPSKLGFLYIIWTKYHFRFPVSIQMHFALILSRNASFAQKVDDLVLFLSNCNYQTRILQWKKKKSSFENCAIF